MPGTPNRVGHFDLTWQDALLREGIRDGLLARDRSLSQRAYGGLPATLQKVAGRLWIESCGGSQQACSLARVALNVAIGVVYGGEQALDHVCMVSGEHRGGLIEADIVRQGPSPVASTLAREPVAAAAQ